MQIFKSIFLSLKVIFFEPFADFPEREHDKIMGKTIFYFIFSTPAYCGCVCVGGGGGGTLIPELLAAARRARWRSNAIFGKGFKCLE